ncbi:MAG: glycosyltransferase [Runella slithyformis]|nr:MAG: glycosyltransferase [Runella slithyformis]TAE95404.1 MAG: glycosyltransferase [Runella slithyformis]TAF29202.1 MAG: glycosyltransferase [Runella slithyformis]TAF48072.1 MAG: glycosyltransferase [Runella slithyformis]TAF82863.1 MAG: glycosyltransferase [Runella slithyformis]
MTITFCPAPKPVASPLFSILIPTWNNLALVKLCVESIQKNSTYAHQIILHINDGNDGTLQWAKNQELDYTHSPQNVGICYACNAAFALAQADYIVYMNDDMYACPNWDAQLWQAVEDYQKDDFYFSATMIERLDTGSHFVVCPHNFGDSVANFQEQALLESYASLAIADWQGANYPPSLMHRRYWQLIGGFSTEFSPGMYSDPDICMKLWQAGVRNFRGVGSSLVYHFMSKSVERVKKNNGSKQFLKKWGITSHTFQKYYIGLDNQATDVRYRGILSNPSPTRSFKMALWLGRLKLFLHL